MAIDSTLERTIDKILSQTESNIQSNLNTALTESQQKLDNFVKVLEQEYDQIISDGKKEAEKIEKTNHGKCRFRSKK